MAVVVIDDIRSFKNVGDSNPNIVYLRTSQDAIEWLDNHRAEYITQLFFDYDLGLASNGDANVIADYMVMSLRLKDKPPWAIGMILVHTSNPMGGDRLMKTFQGLYPTLRISAESLGLVYVDD